MTRATDSDREVIQDLFSGDRSALGILYDRYGEAVYRLSLRITGNAHEAEDLTQEVFLAFWRGATYDADRGSVLVFLLTLTRSRAINHLRQSRSRGQILRGWLDRTEYSPSPLPMDRASLDELSDRLAKALHSLPENQREILEMAYFDGLSQSEITERLQIPLGTVKTRSRRGLLKLKQLLQDLVS
ncbi:sigma-70 family RNA polymerase sigma factor [Pannus brasiliensis CCIBt3594]|uniref:Sigma-70 family RNA polymerase sigma factor n=1 Tax=Pannus brasiliensis CCIBt3594 TaxID=1427578 RepID=A0AAW9QZ95_9CHRO